jgi:hypothetical protein
MATSSKDLKKETEKAKKRKITSKTIPSVKPTTATKGTTTTSSSSSSGRTTNKSKSASQTGATTKTPTANSPRDPTSVVVRLSRAAKDAAAVTAAIKAQGEKTTQIMRRRSLQNSDNDDDDFETDDDKDDDDKDDDDDEKDGDNNIFVYDNGKRMGSVLDLNSAIEEELEFHSLLAGQLTRPRLSAVEPAFSLSNSQLNLIRHNDVQELRQAHARLRQERNRMSNKNNQGFLLSLDPKEAAAILSLDPLEAAAILGQLPRLQGEDDKVDDQGNPITSTATTTPPRRAPLPSTCHVAVVFPKPLLEGKTTVEYASRLEALARALANGYQPLLICLLSADGKSGGFTGTHDSSVVDDATAGYIYLQQLCSTNDISLTNIDIRIVPMKKGMGEHRQQQQYQDSNSNGHTNQFNNNYNNNNNRRNRTMKLEGDYSESLLRDSDQGVDTSAPPSFQFVVQEIQRDFLDAWLDQSDVYESKTDEYGMTRRQPRKKVHIHFTFFSTDYQLCNLNDIHTRSPRQSLLSTLKISATDGANSMSSVPSSHSSSSPRRCIVETTWSFRYSVYPFRDVSDEVESFLGNCYLMSQDLQPLLVNLRGVVTNVRIYDLWYI